MKATKWIIAGVLAIAIGIPLAKLFRSGADGPPKPVAQSSSSTVSAAGSSTPEGYRRPLTALVVPPGKPGISIDELEDDTDYGPPVRVNADQELANVNGVVLTLKDLMPLPAERAEAEQVMTTVRYNFLLNRAVERELTFQMAKAEEVELTEVQRQSLAEAADRRNPGDEVVFDDLQDAPENADFQQRDFKAMMLQSNLAERSGVPSPHVGQDQVLTYYEANLGVLGALPTDPARRDAAWSAMESKIRTMLAPVVRQQHQEQFELFVQQLKDNAEISTATQ